MNKNNLCYLYNAGNNFLAVECLKNFPKKEGGSTLEIDMERGLWRYMQPDTYMQSHNWHEIGKGSHDNKSVQMVFDKTDFEQLKRAFSVASHNHARHDHNEGDD
ncbi:MAG: hypothetical protein HGA67_01780 [Candidatus Yonathbacteria bacterium]|nr:hypothetical protein [Candidatus Yonathbacteria bacterium]